MTLILVAVIGLLWLLVIARRDIFGFPNLSKRGAFVLAFGIFEILLVGITEVASLGHHLTTTTILAAWGVVLAGLAIAAMSIRKSAEVRALAGAARTCSLRRFSALDPAVLTWTVVIVVIFAVLAVIGWLYPPNNADSHAYHLARVEHWIQNRTVAHYTTHYLAQIELAPLNSFNLAHLHLLSGGGDRLDGFVQWYAMLVCVVGASEMARLLGANRIAQIVSAVVCAVIPSVILEATSTQNNVLAAAVGVALFVILLAWSPGKGWIRRSLALGFFTGLAGLAKGTLPMLLGPALVLLGISVLWREGKGRTIGSALGRSALIAGISCACAVMIVGPFIRRNFQLFGGPAGPVSRSTMSYQLTPKAALANIVRSSAANFRIGNGVTGLETKVSRIAMHAFSPMFNLLGVAQENPRYFLGTDFGAFKIQDYSATSRNEGQGANPWHAILSTIAVLALGLTALMGKREHRFPFVLALALLSGSLLFAALARWNVYGVRYYVPVLVAFSPFIAIALTCLSRWVTHGVGFCLVLACMPQLLGNVTRSLWKPSYHYASAMEPYFVGFDWIDPLLKPYTATAYDSLTETISRSSCQQLGISNWILLEYPIWAGLRHHGWPGSIQCVGVQNESRSLENLRFQPDAWLRDEDPHHVPAEDGKVHLQFDRFALAMPPERANPAQTKAARFMSTVADVGILPGGGWSQQPEQNQVVLTGRASIYLYAKAASSVRLEFRGNWPNRQALSIRALGTTNTVTGTGTDPIAAEFALPPGITRIELFAPAGNDATEGSIKLTGVIIVGGVPLTTP